MGHRKNWAKMGKQSNGCFINIHQNPKFLRFPLASSMLLVVSCDHLVLEASAQLKNLRKDRETSVARVPRISQTAGQG